jgi:hypothetical protein
MLQVNMAGMDSMVQECYEKKVPLFIAGGVGIGKSHRIRYWAETFAKKENKKFLDWAKTSMDQKLEAIKNADDYFVFCDQRISQKDPTDLQGIFNLSNKDMLDYIPHSWCLYYTQEKAHGIIFFDEINLATPLVSGSAYQIIHDRIISDRKLADDVFVVSAGNRACDKAYVFEMPLPLEDRFMQVELLVDADAWCDWAIAEGVSPHLISFIKWKPTYIYKINDKRTDKSSTPRGITRADKLIRGKDITETLVHQLVSASVGEAFATEFGAYVKLFQKLDWKTIFDNPKSIKDFAIDKKYALMGGMVELFNKTSDQPMFDNIMGVLMVIDEDYAIITLRQIIAGKKAEFRRCIKKAKSADAFIQKYAKYIVEV